MFLYSTEGEVVDEVAGETGENQAEVNIDSSGKVGEDPYDWVIFLGGTNDLGVSHLSLGCLSSPSSNTHPTFAS